MALDQTNSFLSLDPAVAEAFDRSYTVRTNLNVPLTQAASNALHAVAFADGKTVEELAGELFDAWAHKQFAYSDALVHALTNPPVASKENERSIEQEISRRLRSAGVKFKTQVKCAVGIADLVVGDCVVELKYRITGWRELHQACGQAKAYATEMGLAKCMVAAKHIDPKLMAKPVEGVAVWMLDDAVKQLIQSGY